MQQNWLVFGLFSLIYTEYVTESIQLQFVPTTVCKAGL